jgi:hypothetical protein
MKKKYRRLFHDHDIHDYCVVEMVAPVTGYDYTRKFLAGPWTETVEPDGTVRRDREMIEVDAMFGDPIYGKPVEVHNP